MCFSVLHAKLEISTTVLHILRRYFHVGFIMADDVRVMVQLPRYTLTFLEEVCT